MAVAEQALELCVITQVPVADDHQRAARLQRGSGFGEHLPGHGVSHGSVPVENSLRMRSALKAQDVPVETHLFASGGHGFGLRRAVGKPVENWPELWLAWAARRKLA